MRTGDIALTSRVTNQKRKLIEVCKHIPVIPTKEISLLIKLLTQLGLVRMDFTCLPLMFVLRQNR